MMKPFSKPPVSLDGLDLPAVTQIGMVVPDLMEGVRLYRNFFNIPKWYHTLITECSYYYKDRPVDILLDIAVGYSGKTQIELIQVIGKDDNIYRAHPGEAGFGFHHFGVVVDDLDKAKAVMKGRGHLPLQEGTLKYAGGGKTRVAYLDTVDSAGLILELIETKAFGLNLGMPEWLINLGRITGDTKNIPA